MRFRRSVSENEGLLRYFPAYGRTGIFLDFFWLLLQYFICGSEQDE